MSTPATYKYTYDYKKRNSTRKKLLTNSQDTNINVTFTQAAFFINKENYCDWSVMFKNRSASCRRTIEER